MNEPSQQPLNPLDTINDDYDSPWKDAIEHCFPEFLAFYFPDSYQQIDWAQDYTFLDQELRAIVQDAELGKRFVDKLVRVSLLNGTEHWVYIHIEVQGSKQADFAKRMFVYNYRLFDRYDKPIASLAVLADETPDWRPDYFAYSLFGSTTSIQFPIAKLTDYHDQLDSLQNADNPFALVTAAHIYTQRTRKNTEQRYAAKFLLIKCLYQRQWDKQRIIDLLTVIDWMLKLPESLEQKLKVEIEAIEENERMRYVTSFERIGIAKGLVVGERKTLSRQLQKRFQTLPDWAVQRIAQATATELDIWLDNVLDADTIEAVFTESPAAH